MSNEVQEAILDEQVEKIEEPEISESDKEEIAQAEKDIDNLKTICEEFVKEKIITLSFPVSAIEESVPKLIGMLLRIHKNKSPLFQEYLDARQKMEEQPINEIKYDQTINS